MEQSPKQSPADEADSVLARGMPFGYDPATGFFHADDGGAPASTQFYVPKAALPIPAPDAQAVEVGRLTDQMAKLKQQNNDLIKFVKKRAEAEAFEEAAQIASEYDSLASEAIRARAVKGAGQS